MIGNVWYSAVKVRFNGAAADMLVCFFFLACFRCLARKLVAWGWGFTAVVLERRSRGRIGEAGLHPSKMDISDAGLIVV